MKICLWGSIAGALRGSTYGGSELQYALLAKALARGGHEVVIIDHETTEDFVTGEGIKVIRINGWNKGIRFVRIFTHRLPQLYINLKNQKADIYYCRMRDFTHFLAFWAAKRNKAKFILAMASDLDALGFWERLKHFYIPNFGHGGGMWWFFSGILMEIIHPVLLRKADMVFVQHEGQKRILLRKHVNSFLFQNLLDLNSIPVVSDPVHNDFVYVGWLDKRKGFAEFYNMVTKLPFFNFKVIGPPRDKTGHLFYNKLKSFPNVFLMGELNHSDTLFQIANSRALISTSPMEGFPNIFIEAWAYGIPVLSLHFDPGDVIIKEGLGAVADGNLAAMMNLMKNIGYSDSFAIKAKAYVKDNHALDTIKIDQISKLFEGIRGNGDNKEGMVTV